MNVYALGIDAVERAGSFDAITAADVVEGARAADGVAVSVVRDTGRYVGMAAANFAAMLDPELVVLAGVDPAVGRLLSDEVRLEAQRRLPAAIAGRLRIDRSPLGADAIAIGAARVAALSCAPS